MDENIVSQVLFYYDWLVTNRREFTMLVVERLGLDVASAIDWSKIRLLCIASEYGKYDAAAVRHINRPIELLTYRHYGPDLLLLEYVTPDQRAARLSPQESEGDSSAPVRAPDIANPHFTHTLAYRLSGAPPVFTALWNGLTDAILALGDDVQLIDLKHYRAMKRLRNFACLDPYPKSNRIAVFLRLQPADIVLERDFTRDMSSVGHYGTGDLEVSIRSAGDIQKALPLIQQSYDGS